MSIKSKLTLWLLLVVLLFCVAIRSVLQAAVAPSFAQLEHEEARRDIDRVLQKLASEVDFVDRMAQDWAAFDDAYNFVQGKNDAFPSANVSESTHDTLDLVLIQVSDLEGRVLLDDRHAPPGSEPVELRSFPPARLPADSPLRRTRATRTSELGLLLSEWGPLLVSAQPVMLNDRKGEVVGTLIMARALDAAHLARYRAETHVEFTLEELQPGLPTASGVAATSGALRATPALLEEHDREWLQGSSTLHDFAGQPVRRLLARIPRSISARGDDAIRSAWISTLAAGLLLLVALYWMLQRSVVGPLTRFTHQALALKPRAEVRAELELARGDELGQLARRFDQLLEQTEVFQARLTEASHKAGMSEVATNVLHNVGNMLNSVGISTTLVQERCARLPTAQLGRVVELLRSKGDQLGPWIADDPAGRRLPEALGALERLLQEEQEGLRVQCDELRAHFVAIAGLIRSQQALAGGAGFLEEVDPAEQFEVALRILQPEKRGIRVERRFAAGARLRTQRHKLLQLLVNLIKNAIEAFDGVSIDDKRLTLTIEAAGDALRFTVADNASGIRAEDLPRLFQHGFTTKPGGHGFGLHSVANSVTELGGSIRADSAGPGRGASFLVELPPARPPVPSALPSARTESAGARAS